MTHTSYVVPIGYEIIPCECFKFFCKVLYYCIVFRCAFLFLVTRELWLKIKFCESTAQIMKNPHRIIAKIASWSRQMMEGSDLQFYLTWLKDQLKTQNEYLPSVARCLQMMLRLDPYRMAFDKIEGIKAIIAVLSSKVNFQIQYQVSYTIFCTFFRRPNQLKLAKPWVYPWIPQVFLKLSML